MAKLFQSYSYLSIYLYLVPASNITRDGTGGFKPEGMYCGIHISEHLPNNLQYIIFKSGNVVDKATPEP